MRLVKRNKYPQIDRQNVQDRVALFAEGNTEAILRKYEEDSRSHEGHYVSADLMKEMFPEYSASSADRARYSNPVHNTATALADEQFSRTVKNDSQPERNQAMFVTGVPGAGKSAAIESMVDST
jgi:RNase adaptor protein for sRNA GlmZ degradation